MSAFKKSEYQGKHLKENVVKSLRPMPSDEEPKFDSPAWLDAMMEQTKKKEEECT